MGTELFSQNLISTLASQNGFAEVRDSGEFLAKIEANSLSASRELVLFDILVPPSTKFYAEGFQMLSQTEGTLDNPVSIGRCPDDRMPYERNPAQDFRTFYNFIVLELRSRWVLLGFTSCFRFTGIIRSYPDGRIKISQDFENAAPNTDGFYKTEKFCILESLTKQSVLKKFSELICKNHPPKKIKKAPIGWCSWYRYYAGISTDLIMKNLREMRKNPALSFVQIDDGYQTHMGDWLTFTEKFPGGLAPLVKSIKSEGKEPALWVAPFIASADSELAREHREMLAKDDSGNPLVSEKLTYGGWRDTPWHAIDFTNQSSIEYIKKVFSYYRHELGIKYFKLDACYWGAIKGYRFSNPNATRIENYRLGMKAIHEACGEDTIILGCNAPMWASLGLCHAMRVSDDIERKRGRIIQLARETINRIWMNESLYMIDPDCLCLNNLGEQHAEPCDYRIHSATVLLANGILMLGDGLAELAQEKLELIEKIIEVRLADKKISCVGDNRFRIQICGGSRLFEVAINLGGEPKDIELGNGYTDFFSGCELPKKITLNPMDALIAKAEK